MQHAQDVFSLAECRGAVLREGEFVTLFTPTAPPAHALPPYIQTDMHMKMNLNRSSQHSQPNHSSTVTPSWKCALCPGAKMFHHSVWCASQGTLIDAFSVSLFSNLMSVCQSVYLSVCLSLPHSLSLCVLSSCIGLRLTLNMLGPLWPCFVVPHSRYHPFTVQTMGSVDAGHGGHVPFADVHYLPILSFRWPWSLSLPALNRV